MTSVADPPSDRRRFPSHADATVRRASGAIGGMWGRHAGVTQRAFWNPLRVVLAVTLVTLLLGYAQKAPCATGVWTGDKQYTHMCYSDVVPLWSDERLDVGAVPYRDTAVEYPVLTGGFMWLTAELTRGAHAVVHSWDELVLFGVLTALLLGACGLATAGATAHTARRRPYDAMIFAASPLLIFHAYSNWDLLAMSLTAFALWAWAREKPVLSGAFIGLGAAAKLYPVFLLIPIGVLAYRTRRYAEAAWALAAAVIAWLTVNLPVALAYPQGWKKFYSFSLTRPAERSTAWAMIKTLVSKSGGVGTQDAVFWKPNGVAVALVLVIAVLGVVWVGLYAPVRPRLAQLAFLSVVAFLITTKVWSPQYSLWLVPLLALARPRWRIALIWQASEIAVWMLTLTLLLGFDKPEHSITYGWLMLALLIRDALLLGICGLIVYEMWHPELDVVRQDGVDDPGGGVFDGAPDAWGRADALLDDDSAVPPEWVSPAAR